ncbi:hypothetical protein [Sutterella sp.]|uniref:hypothetical protein n=1 Tax=Sutterella sp. TaxID=1981025 RepID=UPI0026E0B959|nr:hypothetical protein [Sutterella sp.]MDO5531047.1 hypothetical protein [Sutterella sp.]
MTEHAAAYILCSLLSFAGILGSLLLMTVRPWREFPVWCALQVVCCVVCCFFIDLALRCL